MGHVAGGVDVDEPANTGDDEEHDHGEVVDLEIEPGAEISGHDPGEVLLHPGDILRRKMREFADGFERGEEGEARGAYGDRADDLVRPLAAEEAVNGRSE